MATGDKLVTLDGLKAVYDDVRGDIGTIRRVDEVVPVGLIEGIADGGWKGAAVGDTITASTSDKYKHFALAHKPGYSYRFKVRCSISTAYQHYIYAVDANDVILQWWGEPADADKTPVFFPEDANERLVPPDGTDRVCVTTYGDLTTLGVTVSHYDDLQTQVAASKSNSDADSLAADALRAFGAKLPAIIEKNGAHDCLNFAFVTDTHVGTDKYGQSGFRNIDLFAAVANSGIPAFAVHDGDISNAETATTKAQYMGFVSEAMARMGNISVPLYVAMGNHDCNGAEGNTAANAVGPADWMYMTQLKAQATVQNNGYASGYFYVDYDTLKIRIIVLDSYYYDESSQDANKVKSAFPTGEGAWFGGTALNLSSKEDPGEWAVLVFLHKISNYSDSSVIWNVIDAFRNSVNVTKYDTAMNFHDWNGGENGSLVAIIQGHEHGDAYASANGANLITVTAGKGTSANIGTIEQYAVSVFTVDPTARKIYETRIGRGSDREYSY